LNITGTDNTAFIQAAINFAVRNGIRVVYLPGGAGGYGYVVKSTIHLGWGNGFYSVDFQGDNSAFAHGLAGTIIIFTATDRQCMNIAGARANTITGINFYFPQNSYYVQNHIALTYQFLPNTSPAWGPLPANPASWCDPTLTNALALNCPLAAITVDAWSGSRPTPSYPDPVFPPWTGITTPYGRALSSTVRIRDCFFIGWPVAFVLGVNTAAQGDFTSINNCFIQYGAYGISINNTQSRNVDIRNIYFAFMNTLLDNTSFGGKNGEWAGPIMNLSGGESYQIFNFGTGLVGGLTISNVYSEGGLRRFGVWGSYQGLKLENWLITFDDSQYEASRGLVENLYQGTVTFERCQFGNNYGIQNLAWAPSGAGAKTIVGDGNYFTSGTRFTGSTGVPGYQAQAYGGGFLINGFLAPYPAAQNKLRGASAAYVAYPTLRAYVNWSDEDIPGGFGGTYIALFRDGVTAFRDAIYSRRWQIRDFNPSFTPLSNSGRLAKTGVSGSTMTNLAQSGETVTFTHTIAGSREASFGYNHYGFGVGDMLVDNNTGAILVVTAKTLTSGAAPPATTGVYTVTAVQQNAYISYPNNTVIGTGNGTQTAFTATLTNLPVRANSVTVKTAVVTGTDDGNGNITGSGIAAGSTINYTTGAVTVNFTTAPASGVAVNLMSQGNWTTTTVLSSGAATTVPTSGGYFQVVRSTNVMPLVVYFGDFTAGSPNVVNIHAGDFNGSQIASNLLPGMLLFAPGLFNNSTTVQAPSMAEYPVRESTFIGALTNGTGLTGGTMTLVGLDGTTPVNAINTGRYPISTVGLDPPVGAGVATVARSSLAGLMLSTNGITQLTIAPGAAADSTNLDTITLSASLNKTMVAWGGGNNQGGLDTGAIAPSTWYHVFLIKKPTTNPVNPNVDALFSLSPTAPTLPTGYTLFRRLGSMRTTAASQWTTFVQNGDEFLWTTAVNDVNAVAITTTPIMTTLTVPTGLQVFAAMNAAINATTAPASLLLNSPDESAQAATATNASVRTDVSAAAMATNVVYIRTNTSAQVRAVGDGATGAAYSIYTRGWVDRRGRDL
jgi:hypothetical protein